MDAEETATGHGLWKLPDWLEDRLLPDSRFAKAYGRFGDASRALLKRTIAAHYALAAPRQSRCEASTVTLRSGLCHQQSTRPADYAILLLDGPLDAPALALAALMPLLTSGIGEVLVVRLGSAASIPDSLLTACELAGQERFAALGPAQVERLLVDCSNGGACAQCGSVGVLLYAATDAVRRVLDRPVLRRVLFHGSVRGSVRALPLALPSSVGLWRDAPGQFPAEPLALLYAGLPMETAGLASGARMGAKSSDAAWNAFAAQGHEVLLVPDDRFVAGPSIVAASNTTARLCIAESQLGLWHWQGLTPNLFMQSTVAFSSAR